MTRDARLDVPGDEVPAGPGDTPVILDAFTGADVVRSSLGSEYAGWALGPPRLYGEKTLIPTPPKPEEWRDPRVGWGVVLPERDGLDAAALARADDAPEPVRELVVARPGAKVLRYRPGGTYRDWTLRDYRDGSEPLSATAGTGTAAGELPMYLLLVGGPAEIPWHIQYALNPVRYVGRLDLDDDGLANYVTALLAGWPNAQLQYSAPVTWAVDLGGGDITTLMREAIAAPLVERFRADSDMTETVYISGERTPASGGALADALAKAHPALVVTTSHGMTGPLDDSSLMATQLGMLVDQSRELVPAARLLADWQPDGAIWFAQACCSAGADSPSAYTGLFPTDSLVAKVLDGVAKTGAVSAPLPQALLGASRPLRAFIGHVEPTFDWTIRFPPNRQRLTSSLRVALYDRLCSGLPIGLALNGHYDPVGSLLFGHTRAVEAFDSARPGQASVSAIDMALYSKVTAYDRLSTVILGDPTVAIPLP